MISIILQVDNPEDAEKIRHCLLNEASCIVHQYQPGWSCNPVAEKTAAMLRHAAGQIKQAVEYHRPCPPVPMALSIE